MILPGSLKRDNPKQYFLFTFFQKTPRPVSIDIVDGHRFATSAHVDADHHKRSIIQSRRDDRDIRKVPEGIYFLLLLI